MSETSRITRELLPSSALEWHEWRSTGRGTRSALIDAAAHIYRRYIKAGENTAAIAFYIDPPVVAELCRAELTTVDTASLEWSICALLLQLLRSARRYDDQCAVTHHMYFLRNEFGAGTAEDFVKICLGNPATRGEVLRSISRRAEIKIAITMWHEWRSTGEAPRPALIDAAVHLYRRLVKAGENAAAASFYLHPDVVDELSKPGLTTAATASLEWSMCAIVLPLLRTARKYDDQCVVTHHMSVLRNKFGAGTPEDFVKICLGNISSRGEVLRSISRRAKTALAITNWHDWRSTGHVPRLALLDAADCIFKRLVKSGESTAAVSFYCDRLFVHEICREGVTTAETVQAEVAYCRTVLEITERHRNYTLQLIVLRHMAQIGRRSASNLVKQGRAHIALGEYDEALVCANSAQSLSPQSFGPLQLIFRIYGNRKQVELARDHLQRIVSVGALTHTESARLAVESGQIHAASGLFDMAWRENRSDRACILNYAKYLLEIGAIAKLSWLLDQPSVRKVQAPEIEEIKVVTTTVANTQAYGRLELSDRDQVDVNELLIDQICLISSARAKEKRTLQEEAPKSERTRVAIVIDSLGPGGAQRQCYELSKALNQVKAKIGLSEITIFARNVFRRPRDGFFLDRLLSADVKVVEYFDPSKDLPKVTDRRRGETARMLTMIQPKTRAQTITQLASHLEAYDPDVIYGWLDELVMQCGVVKALLPKVRVMGRWGSMPPGQFRNETSRKLIEADRQQRAYRVLRRHFPDIGFFANTRATANAYEQWLNWGEETVGVIYNGYDMSQAAVSHDIGAACRQALNIPKSSFLFGTVIRMSEEKRPFLLCDIASRILEKEPSSYFVIVGDGPLFDDVQDYADRLGGGQIILTGRKENVFELYSAMNSFLLTSSVEGLSNALIEAQWSRLPVVCFDVGGLAEGVLDAETGFLVPEGEIETFVERCLTLVRSPGVAVSMGQRAHQFVQDSFSVEQLVNTTLSAFRETGSTSH